MIGAPVFAREVVRHARRPRTYTFQAIFLLALVLCLIPFWPAGAGQSGAQIADTARSIFEWGGYLQLVLLALLAPAVTANAITEEKSAHTLDLLLLTGTGPFSIVLGKFVSRLYVLLFLLYLTVPLLFALLTLGGVAASTLLMEVALLAAFAVFATGLGVFLSTVLPRTTSVLVVGYVLLGLVLAAPFLADATGLGPPGGFLARPGPEAVLAAHISPMYDMALVFNPTRFSVLAETTGWWVAPAWGVGAGMALILLSGLLLPRAQGVGNALSLRRTLDAFDRATYLLLRPGQLLRALRGERAGEEQAQQQSRPVGQRNPIYWKETTVNTIGRFKHWWRVNLLLLAGLVGTWVYFGALNKLGDPEFHRVSVAILAGLIVILTTVIAATTVSREREDGTLILLATTPVDCATYVAGKMLGIARNIVFLVALPFLHVVVFTLGEVISPWTVVFMLLSVPVAAAASIMQGIFVSLLFPTTLRAIVAAIVLIIGEAMLPFVCCLPQFNLPVACYYMVAPASGMQAAGTGGGTSMILALLLASSFGAGTQLGYTFVVYSLIRSGFDRYIGRAA